MFDAISGHDGVVNQMVGDGLMAIFGAPTPDPRHAENAVRAALEMVELIELFNQQQAAENKVQIQIGVGIATGRVIAGYTGTQQRATYTCVGDTVNLAARLESHTKIAGQPILVDENTFGRLSETIKAEDLGPVEIKGKTQSVRVFAVPVGALNPQA
jgi:adenylate cyclase